jgi:hypothetical protein
MPTELSQVLDAIGGLKANVTNLTEGVKEQGEKLDVVRNIVAAIRPVCEAHGKELNGHARTLYGLNGNAGLVKEMGIAGERLDAIMDNKKETGAVFWRIGGPIIVAIIISVCAAAWALWNKMQ